MVERFWVGERMVWMKERTVGRGSVLADSLYLLVVLLGWASTSSSRTWWRRISSVCGK
jgi:hypothetical protein